MLNRHPRLLNSLFAKRAPKERRPFGVSRKRKKQLSFEPLESRQVMSATPLFQLNGAVNGASAFQVQSYSSATPEGQLQQLINELYWQSLMTNASAGGGVRSMAPRAIPLDPLVTNQWHLVNSGQQVGNPDFQVIFGVPGEDINVAPVWNAGYTGAGVKVGVIDSGVELAHPDLAANINVNLAFDALNPTGDGNPNFLDPDTAHGTAVAGLIGAVANNGVGGAGVAPGVSLVPIRLVDTGQTPVDVVEAFRHALQNGLDITNNSWGPVDTRTLDAPSPQELLAIRDTIFFGRGGLGMIHVWSSGNGGGRRTPRPGFPPAGALDNANYDGYANSRYTLAVTGVDHDGSYNNVDGTVTSYPEAGANVLVAAPTGSVALTVGLDTGVGSGLVTTDLTGNLGYNQAPDPNTGEEIDRDFLPSTDYTSRFNGTSGAAPIVTGAIALMLEVNPNLNWRDVQEILIRSARQNDPLGVPTIGAGLTTQNPWITNQAPIFHDPDLFNPQIPVDPDDRTLRPTLDPNRSTQNNNINPIRTGATPNHHVADPFRMTTGAGYTVSQGTGVYGEQIGYGHGVIDVDMAVKLAQQWHLKNQNLPSELTFTTFLAPQFSIPRLIPAAEVSVTTPSGFQHVVPGGIDGANGFIALWNEYYSPTPFAGDPTFPQRGGIIELTVPDNNAMTIESVDVKLAIGGDASEAMDHLRILLVSPDGTHSELNHYWVDLLPTPQANYQWNGLTDVHPILGSPGSNGGAQFVWTFNTNRSWGERSDEAIVYDPVTGEPVVDELGVFRNDLVAGKALTQGWRLVIENWDNNDSFTFQGLEVAWHGSPINAQSRRIQGFVGVDDNRDDLFNFSRVIQSTVDLDGDPGTVRLGEVVSTVDLTQESFAGNVTVVARRASDNIVVDRFVTGHDGNYYFDLIPDDYIISIEDPRGRVAQEDSLTPAGFLQDYKTEWLITRDHFKVWDKAPGDPTATPVDANGVPIAWLDGNGDEQEYGMRGINFLLDPGDAPPQQVVFSGVVYADVNGDGVFNGDDIALPNASVFGDVNRNGAFDAGEMLVKTDAAGKYSLVVPTTAPGVMSVGIVPPAQWTAIAPAAKLHTRFVTPGNQFGNLDFYIKPPADNIGGGGINQPGILMGVVFQDVNGNGVRNGDDLGAPGFTVYIDANNNGVLDGGDTSTTTNQHGAYVFTNVAPGQRIVRVVTPTPFQQTLPANNLARVVNLTGSSTISSLHFGIKDTAVLDYGDLPAVYGATTAAQNGARHRKGVYFLGSRVDGELNGAPTANADGDDVTGFDDEDGIVFDPIVPGTSVRLVATASRNNGYLKGWIDWNGDGDFNDANERLVFSGAGGTTNNALLSAGANQLFINVPAGVNAANVYARFRYGEATIDSIFGEALIGEVEDYRLPVAPPAIPAIVGLPSDTDGDGDVDGSDFLNWQRNFGMTTGATQSHGSADGDGDVDKYDLNHWKQAYGAVAAVSAASSTEGSAAAQTPATASLAAELQTASSFAAATTSSFSSSLRTAGATLNAGSVSPRINDGETTDRDRHARRLPLAAASRLVDAAERLRQRADRLEERFGDAREQAVEALRRAADRLDEIEFDSHRRDRALEDMFGSRRRQGMRMEIEAEAGEQCDADEAFALLADHFERPRG